jgi:hypothetical protein
MGQAPGMTNLTLDQAGKTFDLKEKMHTAPPVSESR